MFDRLDKQINASEEKLATSKTEILQLKEDLAAEQTVGMSISVDDADLGLNANGVAGEEDDCGGGCPEGFFWQAQMSMAEQFMNTGGMPDIFLTAADGATAVEATSWGQLKTIMKEDI